MRRATTAGAMLTDSPFDPCRCLLLRPARWPTEPIRTASPTARRRPLQYISNTPQPARSAGGGVDRRPESWYRWRLSATW